MSEYASRLTRQWVRPLAVLAIATGAAGLPAAGAQRHDVATLAERIDALEARAIRSGGIFGTTSPAETMPDRTPLDRGEGRGTLLAQSDAAIADLSIRIDRLESQMRQQTGQFEEILFKLQRLEEQLRRMQDDNEFRFRELEKGRGGKKRSAVQPPPATGGTHTASTGRAVAAPGSSGSRNPPRTLGRLDLGNDGPGTGQAAGTDLGGGRPLDLSSLIQNNGIVEPGAGAAAPGERGRQITLAPSSDPRDEYDLAYGYILRGDYALAETAFRDFLARNGNHRLAADARFWLGEALFSQRRYRDAADSFLTVYNDHPDSAKVPDSLLKLAQSLARLGEIPTACATYDKLISDYPNASRTVRASAIADRRKYDC